MNYKLKKRKESGFLAIEVLVAVSIITASVLVGTAVAQKSIIVSRQAVHTLQATYLLEEGAEAMRTLRDNTWFTFLDSDYSVPFGLVFDAGEWSLSPSSSDIGIFNRSVTFYTVERDYVTGDIISTGGVSNTSTVLVKVEVSWNEGTQLITKELSFYLNDIL